MWGTHEIRCVNDALSKVSGAQIPPHVRWDKGDVYGLLCGKSQGPEYFLAGAPGPGSYQEMIPLLPLYYALTPQKVLWQ